MSSIVAAAFAAGMIGYVIGHIRGERYCMRWMHDLFGTPLSTTDR